MLEHLESIRINSRLALAALPADRDRRLDVTLSHERRSEGDDRFVVRFAANDAPAYAATIDVRSPFPIEAPATLDAALLFATWPGLVRGGHVHIHGTVSRRLFRNMRELQGLWVRARPDLCRPFSLTADAVIDDPPLAPDDVAILPLTGGVDSMLSLCQHTDPARPLGAATYQLGAALFMPGFSPRMDRRDEFPAAIASVRKIAEARGLPLIVAETDWSDQVPHGIFNHGTLLAGVPMLLSRHFRAVLIGSGAVHQHPDFPVAGSAPSVDFFYDSGALEVRSDVNDLHRGQKCRALCHYPDMLERLMVCFSAQGMDANCCRCEKCTRTMLQMLSQGMEIPAKAFPLGLSRHHIGKRLRWFSMLSYTRHMLQHARDLKVEHPALRVLRRRYRYRLLKHRLRTLATRCIPGVDLFAHESFLPRWLAYRRARAQARKARR